MENNIRQDKMTAEQCIRYKDDKQVDKREKEKRRELRSPQFTAM